MNDGARTGVAAPPVPNSARLSPLSIAVAAILLAGIALRIFAARGELWLDEIWSLKVIDEIERRHDLFWGLAVDNNHYLNTLYLYLVGAGAPVLLQRGLSIVLGTLTILLAGKALQRTGAAGMLAALSLFAVAYPMVNYSSEARGYAGLILCTLAAILLTERVAGAAKTEPERRNVMLLGIANTAGALFQPIMLSGIAGLMAWTAWINRPAGRPKLGDLVATMLLTARRFIWTVRLLLPFVALIAFSAIHAGGYVIAGSVPFSAAGFVAGYGGLLRLLLGLPDVIPDWAALLVAAAAVGLAIRLRRQDDPRRVGLYLIFIVGLPLAMFVARLPNVHFPRYYLGSGIVFLLLLADLFAWAWQRDLVRRALGLVLLAAILVGNAGSDARLIRDGRDQSAAMVRMLGNAGPVLVSSDLDLRNRLVVEFFAARLTLPITYVPFKEICAKPVTWVLSSSEDDTTPAAIDMSILNCKKRFEKQAAYPQWGLSGLPWVVYRAVE